MRIKSGTIKLTTDKSRAQIHLASIVSSWVWNFMLWPSYKQTKLESNLVLPNLQCDLFTSRGILLIGLHELNETNYKNESK